MTMDEDREIRAGEYVLGTLDAGERSPQVGGDVVGQIAWFAVVNTWFEQNHDGHSTWFGNGEEPPVGVGPHVVAVWFPARCAVDTAVTGAGGLGRHGRKERPQPDISAERKCLPVGESRHPQMVP